MKSIKIEKFLSQNEHLKSLNHIVGSINLETTEISRLGLAFHSKFEYFSSGRIQLIGEQEYTLLQQLKKEDLKVLFAQNIPIIIFSRNNNPSEEFLSMATKEDILICQSSLSTAKVFSKTYSFLEKFLAPETQVHGVMLSILGKGVLIKGDSGVGKSEVALELIKRGHILVSDDIVVFRRIDETTLTGEAPELLKSKIEIRGIGIVDIQKLYGVTSVLLNANLDLIIELVKNKQQVDRIGNDYLYETILDVKKKKINIPLLSGKNIANLVEVAVANFQLVEDYNYNSSEEFVQNLNKMLLRKKEENEANKKI